MQRRISYMRKCFIVSSVHAFLNSSGLFSFYLSAGEIVFTPQYFFNINKMFSDIYKNNFVSESIIAKIKIKKGCLKMQTIHCFLFKSLEKC